MLDQMLCFLSPEEQRCSPLTTVLGMRYILIVGDLFTNYIETATLLQLKVLSSPKFLRQPTTPNVMVLLNVSMELSSR